MNKPHKDYTMNQTRKINWINTIFLVVTPLVGIIGTLLLCLFGLTHLATWMLALAMTFLTGLGITAGYHRLFSHQSYQCRAPIRLIYLLFGAAAFEGSVLEWCTDHRRHHRYVDTDQDPYNINQGFWYSHIGWLIFLNPKARDFSNVEDLMQDPLVRFQHRFFVPLGVLIGFLMPMGIGALWGDAWGGLVIAGALRIVFNHHVTFAINSICHTFGKRTYCLKQTAADNWITALFTYGEGYHSYHHKFPVDYRNGIRAYHYDPTKWLIRALAWLKLASHLKQVSKHRILQQQIKISELRLQQKLLQKAEKPIQEHWLQLAATLRTSLQQTLKKVEHLELHYLKLRNKDPLEAAKGKISRLQRKQYRKSLKQAYTELKAYLALWSQLQRQFQHTAYVTS